MNAEIKFKKKQSKREIILDTATQLFIQESYIGVGIDRIITESEIAKATFYKHFPSKEELVIACLQELKLDIQIEVEEHIAKKSVPLEKLEQLYLWYIDWVNQNDARGCPFHKARMDVGDLYPSILVVLDEYRNWLFDTTVSILKEMEIKAPIALTHFFLALLDGIINSSVCEKAPIKPLKTWDFIQTLIELEKNQT
ncbi:TetR/AcrR family transcriptional regulator [Acinetobacter baumannii]|uniref:TetR/AcrR family transcriptional regulator n=1 Tax=Acinetobacter baumannii TaxID=470 RepID=UPI0010575FA8|nr:TetR/AcrR family transcriptional regulator [Acinetobacter baumannii]MCY3197900.1 TetR/AcrR family transcriptional regulator [Acinetobacter baumannii]MCZ3010233.1 TetR/AcrR family transcriptional regulator [Acinetobacter baumannii]MDC4436959.1 TetR/AcrR family transcriptional regulator [Acinetobacter baumannii]MDC4478230.1 TetR/AcrR family transcriptional regulator [Acinetobacter baumannii]MDC4643723.1 TetR/AcrR family transcriptional regulator [Acinetobacter baumannii]